MIASQQQACTTVWRSVNEIDAAAWNSVRHNDDLFMDLRLLRVLESTLGDQTELWFVLIRDPYGEPVAIAGLYTFTPDSLMMAKDCLTTRIQKQVQRLAPSLYAHKVLACGLPLSAGQNYLRIVPTADYPSVLQTLDRFMLQLSRDVGAKYVMLKEFGDDHVCMEHLPTLGYRRADSLPQNVVHPQHESFDDHVRENIRKTSRASIRKHRRLAEENGLTIKVTSDPCEVARLLTGDVHNLYAAVFQKAKRKLEWLPIEFFHQLAQQLPENCCHHFLMKEDKVLAFGVIIFSGTHHYPLFLGVDYDSNEEHALYFNLMYSLFSDGLSRRSQVIEMGQTSDYFKRHKFGCHQSRRSMFVKGTSRLMQWLMLSQFDTMFPQQPMLDQRSPST